MREVFADHLRYSGPIFAIAVLVAAQAVILWRVSAPLVLLLSAPLFALTLYQRSSVRGRVAEKAASTDSLTCLKNRRAFEEDAARRLDVGAVTLCLIDVDRFKQVNDRYGHPTGDAVLERLACALEEAAPGARLPARRRRVRAPARAVRAMGTRSRRCSGASRPRRVCSPSSPSP